MSQHSKAAKCLAYNNVPKRWATNGPDRVAKEASRLRGQFGRARPPQFVFFFFLGYFGAQPSDTDLSRPRWTLARHVLRRDVGPLRSGPPGRGVISVAVALGVRPSALRPPAGNFEVYAPWHETPSKAPNRPRACPRSCRDRPP